MLRSALQLHTLTPRLDGESLHRLATALAEAESQTVVLKVHGEGGVGGVFVDEGRVVWAVAPGTRYFLADRLVAAGADQRIVRELVEEGRRTGVPLGSMLISRGLMSAPAFAELLFEHTVLSLRVMASQRLGVIEPHARVGGAFANGSTFPLVPLLAETVRQCARVDVEPPPDAPVIAVEMVVIDGRALPVRVLSTSVPRLSSLLQLASEAQGVMRHVVAGTASFRRGRRCWSVAGNQSSFVVSEGRSPLSFAWMLGAHGWQGSSPLQS